MKLGTLLAAGRSLALGRNGESPFHADRHVYLPKFGSQKNPFLTADPKPVVRPVEPKLERAVAGVLKPVAAAPAPKPSLPVAAPKPAVAVVAAKPAEKKLSWVNKLIPFGGHATAAKMAADQTATQAELSLDTVKVLRNDLSDADVEIVPLKSRAPAEAAAPAALAPAQKPWEFIGERLFKVETT